MFQSILVSRFFILLSQTGFSQNLKIENYILWKNYYHGDSLITNYGLLIL